MSFITLFSYLKIILLQCFQFLIFNQISNKSNLVAEKYVTVKVVSSLLGGDQILI